MNSVRGRNTTCHRCPNAQFLGFFSMVAEMIYCPYKMGIENPVIRKHNPEFWRCTSTGCRVLNSTAIRIHRAFPIRRIGMSMCLPGEWEGWVLKTLKGRDILELYMAMQKWAWR